MANGVSETNAKTAYKTPRNQNGKKLWQKIKRNKQIYLMLLPVMAFYIVFCYVPMYGIAIAWKDYVPDYGILGSESVGWKWFERFFTRPEAMSALKNTLVISGLKLLFCFPAPIGLALLLNEVRVSSYRKMLQWMVYLPYFLSWVVIGGACKTTSCQRRRAYKQHSRAIGI